MHSNFRTFLFVPAIVFAAACSKDKPADPSLNNDLSLAAQANQTARMDSISAAERVNGAAAQPVAPTALAPAPAARTASTSSVHHATSTHHRSTASSGSSRSSSGSGTVYREPRTEIHKNTNRDAAIGAAAGAVIGGVGSHSVKGGVIGAAAGAILGGVIGNNVDVQKKRVP